jgi:type I restriction enzyme S subunit
VGFPFKSKEFTDEPEDIRLVRGANIGQGTLKWNEERRFPAERYNEFEKYHLRPGDVVLAMDRPWIPAGLKWAVVSKDEVPALLVQRVARLRGTQTLVDEFMRYVIGSPGFEAYVQPIVTGVNVPHISGSQIEDFRFRLPPIKTQKEIANLLGTVDELTENNRRRIEVLEEMARLIYREWFVHFRFPGHEEVELVGSELGPIPEGWEPGQVGDVLRLQRGFDLPVDSRNMTGSVPVLAASGTHGCHDEAKVTGPGVTTGRSGTIGSVTYMHDDFWPLNTVLWVNEYRRSSPVHAYFFLESLNLIGLSSGAAVPTLNRNHVHARKAPVPPERLVSEYDAVAAPMFELRSTLERQVSVLSEARDLLLPRLISGELDVSDLDLDLEPVA